MFPSRPNTPDELNSPSNLRQGSQMRWSLRWSSVAMKAKPALLSCLVVTIMLVCQAVVQSESALPLRRPEALAVVRRQDEPRLPVLEQKQNMKVVARPQPVIDSPGRSRVAAAQRPRKVAPAASVVAGGSVGNDRNPEAVFAKSKAPAPQRVRMVKESNVVRTQNEPLPEDRRVALMEIQRQDEALAIIAAKGKTPKAHTMRKVEHRLKSPKDSLKVLKSSLPFDRKELGELPIQRGSFIFLVMGEHDPASRWLGMTYWQNVTLFFLSWKKNSSIPAGSCGDYKSFFFPQSTWTEGRNELLRQAYIQEMEQGWRFEFFLFFDEDIQMKYYFGKSGVGVKNNDVSFRLLMQLLLRDRPGRAGVRLGVIPLPPLSLTKPTCARACFTDAAIDIYHRTLVDYLMPYLATLDTMSWYMSAYMNNLRLAVLAPKFCSIYRQLEIDVDVQQHGKYPRGSGALDVGDEWRKSRTHIYSRLQQEQFPGVTATRNEETIYSRFDWGLFGGMRHTKEEKCSRNAPDIDYGKLLESRLARWPQEWS